MDRRALVAAAAITAVVTLLRLCGELLDGPAWLFGKAAGGGLSLVGIGWLVLPCGFWFARRLWQGGERPSLLRLVAHLAAGIAVVVVGFVLVQVWIGVRPAGMAVGAGGCVVGGAIVYLGWPALGRWLLAYAVLARLPIVAITAIAIGNDWGTHYEKLAEGAPALGPVARFLVLTLAQGTFWLPITLLGGALGGLLAASRAASQARRAAVSCSPVPSSHDQT